MTHQKNRHAAWLLALLALGMFGFGFALVPLYTLLCRIAGIQTVAVPAEFAAAVPQQAPRIDRAREVTIKFDTTVSAGLPWEFRPAVRSLTVHPGELNEARFFARNLAEDTITGQAIPSILPWQASGHLSKTECFCLRQQVLGPYESREMVVWFSVSPELPPEIRSLTLAYTFMNLDAASTEKRPTKLAPRSPDTPDNPIGTAATLALPVSARTNIDLHDPS